MKASDFDGREAKERLLRGSVKVRANCNIFTYANGMRLEVTAGTIGTLIDVTHEGHFALVRWPAEERLHRTFWDHVELVRDTTS